MQFCKMKLFRVHTGFKTEKKRLQEMVLKILEDTCLGFKKIFIVIGELLENCTYIPH